MRKDSQIRQQNQLCMPFGSLSNWTTLHMELGKNLDCVYTDGQSCVNKTSVAMVPTDPCTEPSHSYK